MNKRANPLLKKLDGFQTSPPGLERVILRRIPEFFLLGSAAILSPSILIRVLPHTESLKQWRDGIAMMDIVVISSLVFYVTMLFTLGLGALIVKLMKGPAYVADAYPLSDSDRPQK